MNKILILTTEGCKACDIAKDNIDTAISQCNIEIELEVKDWHEEKRKLIIENKIKDFPTVLYFVNEKLVHKAVGSYPSVVYLRWIKIYFKK